MFLLTQHLEQTMVQSLKNVDWQLLRKQKEWLVNIEHEHAVGLLNFLDVIQDFAAEQLGDDVVFGNFK